MCSYLNVQFLYLETLSQSNQFPVFGVFSVGCYEK